VLNRLDGARFDWQVPGHRQELVAALIRSLPKATRRRLVPVPDHARAFLDAAGPDDGPLDAVLARYVARTTGQPVSPSDFDLAAVPAHLRMTVRAVDERGRPVAWSKDLGALRERLAGRVRSAIAATAGSLEQDGLRSFPDGGLPRVVEADRGGHVVRAYPALVDCGDSVAVRVLAGEGEQARAMWAGTRRLLLLGIPGWARHLRRVLTNEAKLTLAAAPHATVADVLADAAMATADGLLADAGGPVWDADAFAVLREQVARAFPDTAAGTIEAVAGIVGVAAKVERRLAGLRAPALQPAAADVRAQLDRLLHPGFVTAAGTARLPDLLRYVRAIDVRLGKLGDDPARDRRQMQAVQALEAEVSALAAGGAHLDGLRWQLEELRVATFAQSLGTAGKVSEQRIRRELDRLRRG
jgi:ATP-dependent helicase HrpA